MDKLATREGTRISEPELLAGVTSGYDRRASSWEEQGARAAWLARRWSWMRLAIFALGVLLLFLPIGADLRWIGLLILVAGYLFAARKHRRARRESERALARAAVAREGSARVARRWDELPLTPVDRIPPEHPYAADLGIVGRASLLQLLGPLGAATGAATLRDWLASPAEAPVIAERQEAVRELSGAVDLREELASRARMAGAQPRTTIARFVAWAEAPPWLTDRLWLRVASWVVPAATVASVILAANDRVPAGLPLAGLTLALLILATVSRPVASRITSAAPGESQFATLAEPFRIVYEAPLKSPAWRAVHQRLEGEGGSAAHQQIARLRRTLDAAAVRYSPLLHLALNALLMWDVHVLAKLESWQQESGPRVRAWFSALGEAEALAALGTLAHDHPHWSFPRVEPGAPALVATRLAHPLLPPDEAVANDVAVGPSGTVLLVTGSNMAGKSTLLRAIGANVVLAQAGAPVAADSLTLPPLALASCMRVADSLEDGVSLFMAELQRLRLVVDTARAAREARSGAESDSPALLYLLDEILQGTNTAERQVASRRVLHHLLDAGAIGAVSTHDLELADTPELSAAAHLVHFRETVEGEGRDGRMTFDYKLRDGPATSANALRLVELVGLG